MKVEIWSDIMCPFCYMGKRNFESGLKNFSENNNIEIVWKSFQLNPNITPGTKTNVYDYLAIHKGITREQAVQMNQGLTQNAKKMGLTYNFDKVLVVNSLKAQALIQLAKEKGLGDEAEERFFYANFTEGKDYSDDAILLELGKEIGLGEAEIETAMKDPKYALLVQQDINEAEQLGIRGVPFFVFDRKYAVSGAQPPEAFLEALETSFKEWQGDQPNQGLTAGNGESCSAEGNCN